MQNTFNFWPDDRALAHAAIQHGTPSFVFSSERLIQNIHSLKMAFEEIYPRFMLCYAAKTNFVPDVLVTAYKAGAQIEVVGGIELDLIDRLGLLTSGTVLNGPLKTAHDIMRCINVGAQINVDSWSEFKLINTLGMKLGRKVQCGIRVKRITDADKWARFGFEMGGGSAEKILQEIAQRLSYVEVNGIHFHMGTNNTDLEFYRSSSSVVADWASDMLQKGLLSLDYIDMGGGLASDCPPVDKKTDWQNPSDQDYALAVASPIIAKFIEPPLLIIEPGRRLVDDCFVFLTSVARLKDLERDTLIMDGSINMFPSVQAPHRFHNIRSLSTVKDNAKKEYEIYGCSPMDFDFWGKRHLPSNIEEGDILLVENAGAYSINLERAFSRYIPKILKWDGNRIFSIRREQRLADYLNTSTEAGFGGNLMTQESDKRTYFVAVPVPSTIRDNLVHVCENLGLNLPWVPGSDTHITLAYIGEASDVEIVDIKAKLNEISVEPFALVVSGITVFLSDTTGQSIVAASIMGSAKLANMYKVTADAINKNKHLKDNRFLPHLTLARAPDTLYSRINNLLSSNPDFATSKQWLVDSFRLYAVKNSDESRYEVVEEFPSKLRPLSISAEEIMKDEAMSPTETKRMMIEYAGTLLKSQPKVQAAWLIGSYGRGDNDAYSDFDVCAYVPSSADADEVFHQIKDIIQQNPDVVFSKTLPQGRTVNAITEGWERLDITIIDSERVGNYPINEAKFIFGKELVEPLMKNEVKVNSVVNKADTQATINEFIRVLGLLPVAIGRNDYVLGQTGAQLLRDMLVKIMVQENADGPIRGVLSIRKSLTAEQYSALENVPPISGNKDALLESYKYLAGQFFERGQRISEEQGLTWPARFVEATRRALHSKVGITI